MRQNIASILKEFVHIFWINSNEYTCHSFLNRPQDYLFKRVKLAPQYIQDLINDYITPQRNLHSGSKCLLETPNYNLESYGKRAFSVAAPRLWNSLPMELKTSTSIDIFKKKLKTYLFKHSYF